MGTNTLVASGSWTLALGSLFLFGCGGAPKPVSAPLLATPSERDKPSPVSTTLTPRVDAGPPQPPIPHASPLAACGGGKKLWA